MIKKCKILERLTMATESRAAMAKISAHDTTSRLQALVTAALIWSTTSKPLIELIFGNAVFSPIKVGVSSSRTDPSQPYVVSHSFTWIWCNYNLTHNKFETSIEIHISNKKGSIF